MSQLKPEFKRENALQYVCKVPGFVVEVLPDGSHVLGTFEILVSTFFTNVYCFEHDV